MVARPVSDRYRKGPGMRRQTQRFLVQSFSLLNALFLAFQPLLAVPLVLSTPVAVQAETVVAPESVNLLFNSSSHEFTLRVKTDRSLPYVLTYVDESRDPVVEQAASGDLAEIESGVYGGTIFAGTCSGEVCTPSIVNSGVLQIGDQLKMEYRLVDGQVVMNGTNSVEQECIASDAEYLTASQTLWTVDENQQFAETQTAVKPGVTYQFPLDSNVSVTFTCLPKDESARSSLKIQQIAVEELALPDHDIQEYSKYAYDITTEMENGSFKYELTLPKEEGAEAEIKYIQKTLEEAQLEVKSDELKLVEESPEIKIDQAVEAQGMTVSGLDHFTIFVVVPGNIVPSNVSSFFQQGWRMTSTGNANIGLVDIAGAGVPAGFGPHVIKASRTGGTGNNRSYLGYFQTGLKLNDIKSIKWNRFTKDGTDTYLNIYLINPNFPYQTASVVYHPTVSSGGWKEETFDSSTTGNISLRIAGVTSNITYTQLMSTYGSWTVRNHTFCTTSGFLACLLPANNVQIGGIVIVSGSSSPTNPQEHYFDGITLDFKNQEPQFFNFVKSVPTVTIDKTFIKILEDEACGIGSAWDDDGLKINVTNWHDSYKLMGRYFTAGGDYGGWFDLAPITVNGSNASFFTPNSGNSPAGSAGWEVKVVDASGNIVSNIDSVTYSINTDLSSLVCGGVTVALCKADDSSQPLGGWTVGLAQQTPEFNDKIPVASASGTNVSLPAGDHVVFASGTYRYGSSDMIADAGFSYRPLNIPLGAGGWVSGDQLVPNWMGALKLKVGGQNIAWGGYNPAYQYTTLVTGFAGGDLNLSIWDNNYDDNLNNGNFKAQVHQVVAQGVTDNSTGCTSLAVPRGEYVAFELPQNNWSHVATTVETPTSENAVIAFPAPLTVNNQGIKVTFTNRLVTSKLTVQKTTDPVGDETEFAITATGSGQVTEPSTGTITDAKDHTFVVEPHTYSVTESVPTGWVQTSNNCTNLLVPADGERVCEIKNTKEKPPQVLVSDVTVCKEDTSHKELPGWSVFLKGKSVQAGLSVPSSISTGVNSNSLNANTSYIAEASGTWTNQGGVNPVDAEYSTINGWATHMDGFDGYQTDILELQINSSFDPNSNWGAFNNAHKYVQSFTQSTAGPANFRIFDGAGTTQNEGWFGDNNGSLTVDISEGYAGITDKNGCVEFQNVPHGNYTLGEIMQDGWEHISGAGSVTVNSEQTLFTLTNKEVNAQSGSVSVFKFNDLNTNGRHDLGEPFLPNWEIVLAQGESSNPKQTDSSGSATFVVDPGTYELSEVMQDGWGQTGIYCDEAEPTTTPAPSMTTTPVPPVTVYPSPAKVSTTLTSSKTEIEQQVSDNNSYSLNIKDGETTTCYVGNYEKGNIQGIKYFDNDRSGSYNEGETRMQYWGISLFGDGITEKKVTTDEDGGFRFTNLEKGTYTLCEEDRTNWGWQVTEPAKPINKVCQEVIINQSGETEEVNFGNFIQSRMYVVKSNSAWPTDQKVGDEITYTIKIMAMGGPVTEAQVFDLPPLPFIYTPGSYTAESTLRGDLKGTVTAEPTYASPGVWKLGDLLKDEIVTLTYKVKIGSADPGIYPDMVWATGTSAQAEAQSQGEGDLLALSDPSVNQSVGGINFDGNQGHFGQTTFAGTQVAVVVDQTPSTDHQVAVKVKETGTVLGASTELPATGANIWVTVVAALIVLMGGVMIYLGRKNKSSVLAIALMMGLGLMTVPSAHAMTAVRIAQPYNTSVELDQDATTNQRNMKVNFVVMNTDNKSVTAQCQQSKDGGGWSDIATSYVNKAGGNSGYCEAKNLDNKRSYAFRVRVTGDVAEQYSSTVRVGLDTDGPGTPINYGKSAGNNCEDVIKFRTADDNQTVRVAVYRSDNAEKFTANKDSRAAMISIGPKTDHSLTTSKPDCQKTYFYVVRAFDVNGNGSGLIGDEILTTVIVEDESDQTQTVPVGAVAVGSTVGSSTINPLTGQTAGGAGGVGVGEDGAAAKEDTQAAEGEDGSGLADDETSGLNGEGGEEGSVLGETTGGGCVGWLGSLWGSFSSWVQSRFGLN